MASNDSVPKLQFIPIKSIHLNPKNPRGPNVRDTDPGFSYLKQSIKERGILVPLVVKAANEGYLLVDGERRFHAARELGFDDVPAHLLLSEMDDDAVQSTMFHIHMNWRPWNPAQELNASEPLYRRLVKQFGASDAPGLLDAYVKETGTNKRKARNRLQFHRWPEKIKNEIYERRQRDYWYVIEIEDKIIEPARRNFPEYFERVPVDEVRVLLFKKLQENLVKRARDVRDAGVIASTPREGEERQKALTVLDDLVENVATTFADARDAYVQAFPDSELPALPGPRATVGQVRRLATALTGYTDALTGEDDVLGGFDKDELRLALRDLIEAASELSELLGD
jgi:hypothetical protein